MNIYAKGEDFKGSTRMRVFILKCTYLDTQ